MTDGVPSIPLETYTLPNGLRVIFHVDHRLPIVHVNSWYHVGSKNEPAGRTGLAHFIEHMMFNGSKHAAGKFMSFAQQAGANLSEGGVNGTTNQDRTNFFVSVPSNSLNHILWLESDRLATLTEVLTLQKIETEREVVKNERRQRIEDRPYGRADMLIAQNVFSAGHPYSHDVLGSPEDLTAVGVVEMTEFFNTYYAPNNLSLAITGDFDLANAKRSIEKYYGCIPPGPALAYLSRWIPKLSEQRIIEVMDRVPQERIYFAWPSPAFFDPGDAELDLVAYILANGLSSRLAIDMIHERQLCSDVVSFQKSMETAGLFVIWATVRPGVSISEVEQIVTEHIVRLGDKGPTAEELSRAKAKCELRYIRRIERLGGFGGKADLLNTYNTFLGNPDKFAADIRRHRSITVDDIRKAVTEWIATPNRIQVRFRPERSSRAHNVAIDRSKRPALGSDERFVAPKVKSATLDNGMDILVVEYKDLPTVVGMLVTRVGSIDDPPGKEGLASLHIQAMARGTHTKNALEIDKLLGGLGTSIETATNAEFSNISFNMLRTNLPVGLHALADIVRNPSFQPIEVENEIRNRLDKLLQVRRESWSVAMRISTMLGFGLRNPYGQPSNGFQSTIRTITRDDLAHFHQAYWNPGKSALILVGDISLSDATSLACESFGNWLSNDRVEEAVPAPRSVEPGKVFMVDWPDAVQTVIVETLPGSGRTSQDYYPLSLANLVWGGAASGRLGKNLRYEKGYSYSVRSFGVVYSKYGILKAACHVQTNKTKESVEEFQRELEFMGGKKPITERELLDAKHELVRGYAQQFEGPGQIARQVAGLWAARLPMSEFQRERNALETATLDSVNASARKYAVPREASLLLVGDLSKIESGMRRSHFGQVVILDAEDKPFQ